MPIKDGAYPVATLTCERLGNRYQLVDVSAKLGRKAVIDCIRFEGLVIYIYCKYVYICMLHLNI